MIFLVISTLVCVALLVLSERASWRLGLWSFKPLASTGFIVVALSAGALDHAYGLAVLVSLALCWVGDVLLIPKATAYFRLGLLSFLLGHVAYAVAFVIRGVDVAWFAPALVVVTTVSAFIDRALKPHVPANMRIPVRAYILVIAVMVATAVGTLGGAAPAAIVIGAVLFWISDLFVARNRFVERAVINRAFGLPLYYGGQLLLAWSVSL